MAIRGSLKEASLPDVLQLLSMGKKTGCLSVTHRNSFGSIYFDRGKICYAAIVNRRDRLGDILVKGGAITPAQLDEAIAAQSRERDRRLGEILVGLGMISVEELHRQIRVQIEEAVYFLFTWTQGTFNFEVDIRPEGQDFLVSLSPESLLLEGARRVDEWSLIEKKIPAFDIVFAIELERVAETADQLTPEQRTLLPLIDGQRDVAALSEVSGLVEFDVGKALFGFITAGFLRRVGRTEPAEETLAGARAEEHRNLGIAFYKAAMLEEAEREFRRVSELRTDDAASRFHLGLVHARLGRFEDAVADFERAAAAPGAKAAAWHNLALAYEQCERYAPAREALARALELGGADDPRVHTSLGVVALKDGRLQEATAAFVAARPLFGQHPVVAHWYHYSALAAALAGRTDEAVALLDEGVREYPRAAALLNNLAVALERQRQFTGAIAAIERGVVEEPGLAQLHKNLGDHFYRQGRVDEAFDAYQRAVKYDDALGAEVWLRLGNIRLKRNERAEAVKCWERALVLDPGHEVARRNLEVSKVYR